MLKLGRKVEYALISIMHLDSLPADSLSTTREIAERYNIPSDVLGKVLQSLNRRGLLVSSQGVKGGYRLRKPLGEMVLGAIVEAIEGPVHVAACTCGTNDCPQARTCNIKAPIFHFQEQLLTFLYDLSLDTFQEQTQPSAELAL
jgi:Rrf2 family protein